MQEVIPEDEEIVENVKDDLVDEEGSESEEQNDETAKSSPKPKKDAPSSPQPQSGGDARKRRPRKAD